MRQNRNGRPPINSRRANRPCGPVGVNSRVTEESEPKGGVRWLNLDTLKLINGLALDAAGTDDADSTNQIKPFTVDASYEPFHFSIHNES